MGTGRMGDLCDKPLPIEQALDLCNRGMGQRHGLWTSVVLRMVAEMSFLLTFQPQAVMALWRGGATNKIPTLDEMKRPFTQFPKEPRR
jgi:hypothetical protein